MKIFDIGHITNLVKCNLLPCVKTIFPNFATITSTAPRINAGEYQGLADALYRYRSVIFSFMMQIIPSPQPFS